MKALNKLKELLKPEDQTSTFISDNKENLTRLRKKLEGIVYDVEHQYKSLDGINEHRDE